MRVLVTGAGGFLGGYVVAAMLAAGHQVRAHARSTPRAAGLPNWRSAEVVLGDLLSAPDLRELCSGVDAVVHLAAAMSGSRQHMVDTAVTGTQRLIAALDGPPVRFVLASSFAVYDWDRVGASIDEQSPLLTRHSAGLLGDYALAKVTQEEATREDCARRGCALTVLRPAMVWGAGHWGLDLAGPRIRNTRCIVGPGRALHLTYVENCADAFVAALDERAAGSTCNVEDGMAIAVEKFASRVEPDRSRLGIPAAAIKMQQALGWPFTLAARMGLRVPGLLIPARSRARFATARVQPSRLRRELGWQPPYTFEQALHRAAPHDPSR